MQFLIIDNDAEYRAVLRYHLQVEWPDAVVNEFEPATAGSLPEDFRGGSNDLILLADPLNEERGLDWLRKLNAQGSGVPVILFAADGDEFLAVQAIKAGAANYFPKQRLKHQQLIEAVREALDHCDVLARTGDIFSTSSAGGPLKGLGGHRFVRKLHAGEIASVYLAENEATGDLLTFKVVRQVPDAGAEGLFDRFLQEYEVIARIDHPYVVKIFDLGIADDHAYIAMEYLAAGSLAERVNKELPAETALEYTRQMALALEAIHRAGVLHRDLKPANVMFRVDDTLALIDFGLAKEMRLKGAITGTGQIFGTPYYMSPEQGHGGHVDERSDIYSLGVIFYEMLTGQRPFVASSPFALIYQHSHAERPRLPRSLADYQPLLDQMLATDPAGRFQTVPELLQWIQSR